MHPMHQLIYKEKKTTTKTDWKAMFADDKVWNAPCNPSVLCVFKVLIGGGMLVAGLHLVGLA